MFERFRQFARRQHGQSMVEYGVAIALVAAVAFGAFQTLGQKTNTQFATHPLNAFVGGGGGSQPVSPAPLPPTSPPPVADPGNQPAPPAPSAAPADPAPPSAAPAQPAPSVAPVVP